MSPPSLVSSASPPSLARLPFSPSHLALHAELSSFHQQFAAGETPSWFTGLPADIKTYLVPANTAAAAAPTLASSSTSAFPTLIVSNVTAAAGNASAYGTGTAVAPYPYAAPYGTGASNTTAIANNGTAIVANGTAAVRTTGSASLTVTSLVGVGAGGATTSRSAGTGTATARQATGAAVPTAVMHAGLLGAAGVMAAFAL